MIGKWQKSHGFNYGCIYQSIIKLIVFNWFFGVMQGVGSFVRALFLYTAEELMVELKKGPILLVYLILSLLARKSFTSSRISSILSGDSFLIPAISFTDICS